MKLPNLSDLNTKYKKFSRDLKLEKKFSRLTDTVEKTCAEVSDALGLDEKMMKSSDTLDNFGEKLVSASSTSGADRRLQSPSYITDPFVPVSRTGSDIPNINPVSPGVVDHIDEKCMDTPKTYRSEKFPDTPDFSAPALHTESIVPDINLTFPAALPSCREISDASHADPRILAYYMSYYEDGSAFSDKDLGEYFIKDAGSAKQILKILKNKDWVQEKDPVSILMASYTVEELRTFLRLQGLKVSGKKEELARRLSENVSPEDFKRTYKRTLYSLTELGKKYIRAKKTDHDRAIMISVGAIKNLNFSDAVRIYNSYDARWGFLHANGKPHTIFAGYEVPSKCFDYVISYPMHELQNSDGFKKDLRAFLVSVLMRGERNWVTLREEFMLINQEPICCPNISDLNRYDHDDDFFSENPDGIMDSMQRRIEENPDCVLNYYICKILYKSQRA